MPSPQGSGRRGCRASAAGWTVRLSRSFRFLAGNETDECVRAGNPRHRIHFARSDEGSATGETNSVLALSEIQINSRADFVSRPRGR